MSRTLDLLRMTPALALRAIIAETITPGISSSAFKLGVPVVVSGKDTSIALELDKLNVPVDLWIYAGVVDFRYPRLDLGVEFAKFEPEVVVDFPTTTQSVRESITKRYGILFDENDFVDQEIAYADRNGFTLTSKPESLRWVGSYLLPLKQRVLELNEAFLYKHLDFFDAPAIGSFADLFVAAANELNADYLYRGITKGEISFGTPSFADDIVKDKNTQIAVIVGTSDLYKGQAVFFYNRLNLAAMTADTQPLVKSTRFSEHWEAAVAAGTQLGVTITADDVVPGVLPVPAPGVVADVTIQIASTSKGFTGPLRIKFQRAV